MEEKYSVLMSVYFKESSSAMELALESMINQTVKPDEIILVEDGPLTSELNQLIEQYKLNYPEVMTVIPLKENKGLWNALNIGIEKSRNELIARMDTDDISLSNRCEKQLVAFKENPNLSIIGSATAEFYDSPDNIVSYRQVPENNKEIVKFSKTRNPFNHPTVMYKKSKVLAAGGYKNNPGSEDYLLFGTMLSLGFEAANFSEALLLYRANEDNFARRKSWMYTKAHINSVYSLWKLGHSSVIDLMKICVIRLGVFLAPTRLLKKFSNQFLRTKPKK